MPFINLPKTKIVDYDALGHSFLDEYDDPDENGVCKLLRPSWIPAVREKVSQKLNGRKMNGKEAHSAVKQSSIVVPEEARNGIVAHEHEAEPEEIDEEAVQAEETPEEMEPLEEDIDYSNPNIKTGAEASSHWDRCGS